MDEPKPASIYETVILSNEDGTFTVGLMVDGELKTDIPPIKDRDWAELCAREIHKRIAQMARDKDALISDWANPDPFKEPTLS